MATRACAQECQLIASSKEGQERSRIQRMKKWEKGEVRQTWERRIQYEVGIECRDRQASRRRYGEADLTSEICATVDAVKRRATSR